MENWKKEPIKAEGVACLCCGAITEVLPLETVLYNGYGGWSITKNGNLFFMEDQEKEFEESKTLKDIEDMIGEDSENDYRAILFMALRGGEYQRHAKNNWVLIEQNEGFA